MPIVELRHVACSIIPADQYQSPYGDMRSIIPRLQYQPTYGDTRSITSQVSTSPRMKIRATLCTHRPQYQPGYQDTGRRIANSDLVRTDVAVRVQVRDSH
eukprot:631396-Rhodomonas_salina.1